ncbi:MAG TPA: hypothetical protein VGH33_09120 [Isosphaeraceae bacterium]
MKRFTTFDRPTGLDAMHTPIRLAIPLMMLVLGTGCDSAMIDATPKPEVTGEGPKEPDALATKPGTGNVDLGEVGPGGPLETKAQERPSGAPKPVSSPDSKPH